MLDYPVEGSSPKGLAKKIGLAILTRLVVPGPNPLTGLEVSYVILKKYYSHLDLRRHQHQRGFMTVHYASQYATASSNLNRLSGETSTFSTLTDLVIYSQSARDLQLYKGIQITRDTIGPSNHVHITLIEQVSYWVYIRIYFIDKKIQSLPSRLNPLIA